MNKTSIEWCRTYAADGTFEEGYSVNPVRFLPRGADGQLLARATTMCQKVSPGCAHCYAEGITRRFWPKDAAMAFPGYTAAGVAAGEFVLDEAMLLGVLRHKKPTKIFWGDMTDLFQESVPDEFLDRCFAVCALTPHITHMFLTKRPERMRAYVLGAYMFDRIGLIASTMLPDDKEVESIARGPLPNVWLGVSVENQEQADRRIYQLLNTPAAIKFISAEPLLGAVDTDMLFSCQRWIARDVPKPFRSLPDDYGKAIDWVIVGGESGAGARPMHPDWARGLRDQCIAAGVPFFFKQWGEWSPGSEFWEKNTCAVDEQGRIAMDALRENYPPHASSADGWEMMHRAGKKAAGALLDGREWREFPEVRA